MHLASKTYERNLYEHTNTEEDTMHTRYRSMLGKKASLNIINHSSSLLESLTKYNIFETKPENKVVDITEDVEMLDVKNETLMIRLKLEEIRPLIINDLLLVKREVTGYNKKLEFYQPNVSSCSVNFECQSNTFGQNYFRESYNLHAKRFITGGKAILPSKYSSGGKLLQDKSTLLP
jgi:hypothetical protein